MVSIFIRYIPLLALLNPCLAVAVPRTQPLHRRAQYNQNPTVPGNADDGWQELPKVTDLTGYPKWEIEDGITMPVFQSSGKTPAEIKRAVIVLPGKLRDCWYYGNSMQNALYIANEGDPGIKLDEVSVMAPCFFTDQDVAAGSAEPDVLIFGDTTWASGQYNVGPSSITKYSAYKVIDKLVAQYMDRTAYPNLNTVVVAGHSLGAQMVQRYAALRSSEEDDDRLHYWTANPGSLMWLVADRPVPDASCTGYDEFKYGLDGGFPGYATAQAKALGRAGLVSRYRSRSVHYAWGLDDDGNGDTRCEAETQGDSHIERGKNFVAMMEDVGGVPPSQTVDFVKGIAHYNEGMMNSDEGVDKLFRINYNGTAA